MNNESQQSASLQVRQWFEVCIFPLRQFMGMKGNCSLKCWAVGYRKDDNLYL